MPSYLDKFTRAGCDTYLHETMLMKNTKFLSLLNQWGQPPGGQIRGSKVVQNVNGKSKASEFTNTGDKDYNTDAEPTLEQAEFEIGRQINSVYLNGMDYTLNTGRDLSDAIMSDNLDAASEATLINLAQVSARTRVADFYRDKNKALLNGSATISPVRATFATKVYGLVSDLAVTSGTARFGITKADLGNHDFDKPSTKGTKQPKWEPMVLTPTSNAIALFGDDTNSLQRACALLNHGGTAIPGEAAMGGNEYHFLMAHGIHSEMSDALSARAQIIVGPGMGANPADPNIHFWNNTFYSPMYNAYFHVDNDMPSGTLVGFNRATVGLFQSVADTHSIATGNIADPWRMRELKDMALLPLHDTYQLVCSDLSQIVISTGIQSVTL